MRDGSTKINDAAILPQIHNRKTNILLLLERLHVASFALVREGASVAQLVEPKHERAPLAFELLGGLWLKHCAAPGLKSCTEKKMERDNPTRSELLQLFFKF